MPIEQPTGLIPAADLGAVAEMQAMLRPAHSEFSRYFPRIRGTSPKRILYKGRRLKPKADWTKTGRHAHLMEFFEWADKIIQSTKFELNQKNIRPLMSMLFGRWADGKRIYGSERATIKRFLIIELAGLRNELPEAPVQPVAQFVSEGGFERNKKCWCGSGVKYKRCHIGEIPS